MGHFVAQSPTLNPGHVPQVRHSPAHDPGEITDFFRNPSRGIGHDDKAGKLDPWQ